MTHPAPVDLSVVLVARQADGTPLWQSLMPLLADRTASVEIIIVDGATGDGRHWLWTLQAENSANRIVTRHLSGATAGAARDAGLSLATGRHVLFLSAGDVLADPGALGELAACLRAGSPDMLVAPAAEAGVLRRGADGRPLPAAVTALADVVLGRGFLVRQNLRPDPKIDTRDDPGLAWAARIGARDIGLLDRPLLCGRADPATDAPADAAGWLRELETIAAALDTARAGGRAPPEVEAQLAIHVLLSLKARWRQVWCDLAASPARPGRALLARIERRIAAIVGQTGPLWPRRDALVLGQKDEDDLASGRLDLLRHALVEGDAALLRLMLDDAPLPLARLYRMCAGAPAEAGLAHRALAFHRTAHLGQTRDTASRPLPRIILHVGGMKTGSSALQNRLEANRAALLAQGFLYPTTGTFRETGVRSERNPGHALLISSLLQPARRAAMLAALHAELDALPRRPDRVILSAETILAPGFWMNGQGFARIAAGLDSEIEVVWLHRRAEDWLASIHREEMCHPLNPYPTLDTLAECYAASGLLDNDRIARILRAAPNVRRLHSAAHETVRQAPGGTTGYFCAVAGIDTTGFRPASEDGANLSFSAAQAGLIAILKRLPGLGDAAREEGFRRVVRDGRAPRARQIVAQLLADSRPVSATPAGSRATTAVSASAGFRLHPMGAAGACILLPGGRNWQRAALTGDAFPDLDLPIIGCGGARMVAPGAALPEALLAAAGSVMLRLEAGDGTAACRLSLARHSGGVTLALAEPDPPRSGWLLRRRWPGADPAEVEILLLPEAGTPPCVAPAMARILAGAASPDAPWNPAPPASGWRLAGPGDPPADWQDYFDADAYLEANPDVAAAGVDPAGHHALYGWREGRRLAPDLTAEDLRRMLGKAADPAADPFAEAVARGRRVILPGACLPPPRPPALARAAHAHGPSDEDLVAAAIDTGFYATQAGRTFADPAEAARHYLSCGWKVGFDPQPGFSSDGYALLHVDVLEAGLAPFAHYLRAGRAAGRQILTTAEAGGLVSMPATSSNASAGTRPASPSGKARD